MIYYLFEILCSIIDVITIHFYLKTFFSKTNETLSKIYWLWLIIAELIPLPISHFFLGTLNTEKSIIMSIVTFATILLMSVLYTSSLRHRLFICLFYTFFAGICEDIPGALVTAAVTNNYINLKPEQIELIVQAQYGFFFFLFLSIIRIFYKPQKRRYSIKYSIAILITPTLSILIIGDTSQMMTTDNTYKLLVISRAAALFIINIINFVLLDNIFTIQNLEEEKNLLNQQVIYQINKYNQISTAYRNTRSILHDAKKHFMYLESCIDSNDSAHGLPYIKRAITEMEYTYNKINTGNLVIDAFVSNHSNLAQNEGIEYTTNIAINPEIIPVEDYDLSVILGNLLDNSLEEVRHIKPPAKRTISVNIATTDSILIIHIINSVNNQLPDFKNTTEYYLHHGYGLENARNTIKKYKGSYDFQQNNNTFDVAVRIPIL